MWPRVANAVLGAWLLVSAVLWRHGHAQAVDAAVCGLLAIGFALTGALTGWPPRLFNVIVGAWLILSAVVLPHTTMASAWNQGLVG